MLEFNVDPGDFENDIEGMLSDIFRIGEIFLENQKLKGDHEVSLSFVDDEEMRMINKEYRGKDSSTDVLSFPLLDPERIDEESQIEGIPVLLGDIIISFPRAKEQALEYGHSLRREICFLICHSLLHLVGYDHLEDDERSRMESRQKEIMEKAGIGR